MMSMKFMFVSLFCSLLLSGFSTSLFAQEHEFVCDDLLVQHSSGRDAKISFILAHLPKNSKISFYDPAYGGETRTGVVKPSFNDDGSRDEKWVHFKDQFYEDYKRIAGMKNIKLVYVPRYPDVWMEPIKINGDLSMLLPFLPAGTKIQFFYKRLGKVMTAKIRPARSDARGKYKSRMVEVLNQRGQPYAIVGVDLMKNIKILSIPK